MISPVFERISNEITSVDFYKVDFDKFEDLSTEVGIRAASISFPRLKFAVLMYGPDAYFRRLQGWKEARRNRWC